MIDDWKIGRFSIINHQFEIINPIALLHFLTYP